MCAYAPSVFGDGWGPVGCLGAGKACWSRFPWVERRVYNVGFGI